MEEIASLPSESQKERKFPAERWFERGFDLLSALLFIALLGLLVFSILARDVLFIPTPWLEEIATLFLVYAVASASIGAWVRGSHIAIDILPRALGPRPQRMINIFLQLFSIAFFLLAAYGALEMMQRSANNRTTALALSFSYYYAGLLLAFGGLSVVATLQVIRIARRNSTRKSIEGEAA